MLQGHRHFGNLRDPEELAVRCQLRYLADVLAELRRQPGRGFIGATGLLEHVSKYNTRFSAHILLEFGGPVSARAPRDRGLIVLHHRMVRPKDLRVRSEGRHRASPGLLSSREVTGAARLQPAPAAMSSLSRTWRTSRRCSPSLLGGLTGLPWRATQSEADEAPVSSQACPVASSRKELALCSGRALMCSWMIRGRSGDLMCVLARRAPTGLQGRAGADAGPRPSAAEPRSGRQV